MGYEFFFPPFKHPSAACTRKNTLLKIFRWPCHAEAADKVENCVFCRRFLYGCKFSLLNRLISCYLQSKKLAGEGCRDLETCVLRVMKKLLSRKVAKLFSLKGRKRQGQQKLAFNTYEMYNAVKGTSFKYTFSSCLILLLVNLAWSFLSFLFILWEWTRVLLACGH